MPCSSRDGAVRTLLTSAAESSGTILSTNGSADAIDAMANATISGRIWPQQVSRGQHIGEHSQNACRKCSLPLQPTGRRCQQFLGVHLVFWPKNDDYEVPQVHFGVRLSDCCDPSAGQVIAPCTSLARLQALIWVAAGADSALIGCQGSASGLLRYRASHL